MQWLLRQLSKPTSHNVAWLLGDRVLRLGLGLFIATWIARHLGPADYGLWNYATAFASVFGAVAALGLDAVLVRDFVVGKEPARKLLGTAFVLRFFAAVLAIACSVSAAAVLGASPTVTLLVSLSSAVFLFQSTAVLEQYLQARGRMRHLVIAQATAYVLSSGIKVALLLVGAPLIAFAFASLADAALIGAALAAAYRVSREGVGKWQFSLDTAKALVRSSWPLIVSGLAFALYTRIDQVMVTRLLGYEEAGIYAAAVRISEVWNFVPVAIVTASIPAVISVRASSPDEYYRRFQTLLNVLAAIGITTSVATTLFSEVLVKTLFGENYREAGPVLALHTWTSVFVALGFASGRWLVSEDMATYALTRNLAGAALNVGLNLALIPWLGLMGAALSTLASFAFANFAIYYSQARTRPLFWMTVRALSFVGWRKRYRIQ